MDDNENPVSVKRPPPTSTLLFSLIGLPLTLSCSPADTETEEVKDGKPRPVLIDGVDGYLEDFGLSCELSVEGAGSAVAVKMTLRNEWDDPVRFLPRGTAWDNNNQVFSVISTDATARYVGIRAYRMPPTTPELIAIMPGGEITAAYEIINNHRIPHAGSYRIRLKQDVLTVRRGGQDLMLQHDCGSVTAQLQTGSSGTGTIQEPLVFGGECTTAERATIQNSNEVLRLILNSYEGYLDSGSTVYKQWFGNWTPSRKERVRTAFATMAAQWDTWEIRCRQGTSCVEGNIAWVNVSDDPDRITFCAPWFNLQPVAYEDSGVTFPSRVGVFVHELSHLVAATDDMINAVCTEPPNLDCNGAPDARALAIASPPQAIDSAENYEHFSANFHVLNVSSSTF